MQKRMRIKQLQQQLKSIFKQNIVQKHFSNRMSSRVQNMLVTEYAAVHILQTWQHFI
jgi:hypothetical protein